MNPESSSFARCAQHPSQIFTGFCSTCLAERLSSVDSVGRNRKPPFDSDGKQVACSLPISGSEKKPQDVRVRKTLLSLFHLDDSITEKNALKDRCQVENSISGRLAENRDGCENISVGVKFDPVPAVSPDPNLSKIDWVREKFDPETRACQNDVASKYDRIMENLSSDAQASSSVFAVNVDVNINGGDRKQCSSVEFDNLKEKSILFWCGSVFSRKVLKWRTRSACKRNLTQENNIWNVGFREKQAETKVRSSCDHMVSCNSNKAFWEDPRHSWDGVVMSKAFTPSFAGTEAAIGGDPMGTPKLDWGNSLGSHRRKMSLPEEDMSVDPRPATDNKDMGKTSTSSSAEEKCLSASRNLADPNADVHSEGHHQDMSVLSARRKSNGWSKVWDRSLTSPFRNLSKKHENILERSLSESWRGIQREKNVVILEEDGALHCNVSSVKENHHPSRIRNAGNNDIQRFRPDCQKKRKEFMLGRSRSVHYSSPGNLDNGLLRFYLTPLRCSRRTGKSRRSFARSIFGF